MFNRLDYGVVMRKILLLIMLSFALAGVQATAEEKKTSNYTLDEEKATAYNLKETLDSANSDKAIAKNTLKENIESPKILTEKTATGRIEKMLDAEGKIIAEKTIENDKIVKKVLKYYYPTGQLMRQIISKEDDGSFYAEDYYTNGQPASRATYINENNKIGKEKKYDINGTLRQEIPWILPKKDLQKPLSERRTIRHGNLITYYPEGQIAASFPVGMKGKTTFFDYRGFPIKEIKDAKILNFTPELTQADCQGASIHLGLEELVELYEDEGDISYNKCGFPYRENFVYEVVKKLGTRETKISYDETGMIRRIAYFNNGKKDGLEKKYDAAGNLTAEVNYKNGIKDGFATGYFPTKAVAFRKRYENGKVVDKLTCYFPTGEVAAEFSYRDGLKEGIGIVNSPIKKEIQFRAGQILRDTTVSKKRQMVSAISGLETPEVQCLNVDDRVSELLAQINTKEQSINQEFQIELPQICKNTDEFVVAKSKLICYDKAKVMRAIVPVVYQRGEYTVMNVYTPMGTPLYDISYLNKKKQGWSRKYNEKGQLAAEIYFDDDKIKDSARSFYPNGLVKDLMLISADTAHKMIASYDKQGKTLFSLNYKDNQKQNAFIYSDADNKDIVVRFYEGKPESIRESNALNPYNFIEYNLALGEYAVYTDNELTKGGKLCHYQPQNDVEIITLKNKEETIEPQEEINEEDIEKELIEDSNRDDEISLHKTSEILSQLSIENLPEPSTVKTEPQPIAETEADNTFNNSATLNENTIIPSEDVQKQVELAAKNIGPVAKPDIEQLADVVQKESVNAEVKYALDNNEEKTEKFYYPNNNLRKTVRTKGSRTEEVKEYSKTGLLLTDTMYKTDKIVIEKYFGSGEVRRKTEKTYDDNAVNAFVNRKDFYDNGKVRYEIERLPETMLFRETVYDTQGNPKTKTEQTGPLSFKTTEYDNNGKVLKETNIPQTNLIKNIKNAQVINEYFASGKLKTEITFYNNGEIDLKAYDGDGELIKFAYLAPNGQLHIEKPNLKIIPRYRERYWVDYNNPKWIENQDKYSVTSIAKLNLDIVAKIAKELSYPLPNKLQKIYQAY